MFKRIAQIFVALAIVASAVVIAHGNVKNYMSPCSGANCDNVYNFGGTVKVLSGGIFDLRTGGIFKVNGVDRTSNLIANSAAQGVRAEVALGGTNPTAVTTGLTSLTACVLTLKGSTAPGVGTSVLTYATTGGTLNVYAWKVTNSSTTTLIASTGTETFSYACSGS